MSNELKPAVAPQIQIEKTDRGLKIKIWGARALYANVNTPRPAQPARGRMPAKDPQFDCEFMVPRTTPGLEALHKAVTEMGNSAHNGSKWHNAILQYPDREIRNLEENGQAVPDSLRMKAGHVVIKAHTSIKYPPSVKGEIYSGCCAGAVIMSKPYSPEGGDGRGVNGFLNGVQFQGDGPRLGGSGINVDDELGAAPVQDLPDNDFGAGAFTGSSAPARTAADDDDSSLPF